MAAGIIPALQVAVVILAAGRSSRMGKGEDHKLLATFDGVPLVRKSVLNALACQCSRVYVVTGYRHDDVLEAIGDLPVEVVRNEDYASGMAASLRLGAARAQKDRPDGIVITLADMPAITDRHLDMLIDAFRRNGGAHVVRAVANGSPGNPVILPRLLLDAIQGLEGDVGARRLIDGHDVPRVEVEIGEAALIDVDTVEELHAAGGVLPIRGYPR
ncbi:nucleotidyltransferase family protein [Rhizobium sp. CBN3]|uniref:nucleotidyltransferase family protein n=1 Tax=Rhizobium sp. CBN3 TaxID=3058045 RepID=UPI0026725B56|nr:nucleotidyltransferase family protein [Rhizobium sp. CBN3]MDO3433521.1 nucleotidyltransferase family protein [Rhizobium sp. CBN3]